MKSREYADLKKKDADELQQLIAEKRTEVMNLRFSHATGALEDSARLGVAKRDVAKLLTLLNEKKKTGVPA